MLKMSWRPKGWKNPEDTYPKWHDWESQGAEKPIAVHRAEAFEAGADAMLEAILKEMEKTRTIKKFLEGK